MTVRLIILLLESPFIQLLQAERTHKVLGMEFTKHGRNASTCKKNPKIKNLESQFKNYQ